MNTTERIVVHCAKCGSQNPIAAEFCHKCGNQLLWLEKSATKTQAQGLTSPVSQSDSPQGVRQTAYDYKWAAGCGWLMILAGLFVLFAGLADFLAGWDVIPHAFFPTSKPIGMISAVVLGLLFTAIGITILKKIRRSTRAFSS